MWGNALGWSISAVLVLATAAAMLWIDAAGRRFSRADEFGLDASRSSALQLPDPALVVPSMREDTDAGQRYRDLIERARASRSSADSFVRAGRAADVAAMRPMLEPLLAASSARHATIFAPTPQRIVNYGNDDDLRALELAAKVALRAALVQRQSNSSEARRLYEAVFALGHHLFSERLTYDQLDLGLRLLAESAAGLKSLAQTDELDPAAKVAVIDAFDGPRLALARDRVLPMASRIRSLDGSVVSVNAGNVMHWAPHAGDRVWRVESILAVGRLRHFIGSAGLRGDAEAARRTLELLRNDPDPVIQQAVRAAESLTAEQLRGLR